MTPSAADPTPPATTAPVHVVELAVPSAQDLRDATGADGALRPSWVFRGIKQVVRAEQLDVLGHTDFVTPEASSIARFPLQDYRHHRYLVALSAPPSGAVGTSPLGLPTVPAVALPGSPDGDPDTVLGYVLAVAPKTDNTHLLELDGALRPGLVGTAGHDALWQQVLALTDELDRRTIITYQSQRFDDRQDGSDVVSPSGFGRLRRDAGVRTLLDRGFVLQQCERMSMMSVPDEQRIEAWIEGARTRAGEGYRCTTWHGPTPEHLQDDLAELFRRMSTDVPIGELEYQEETWDAARVRAKDAEVAAGGHVHLVTLVHAADSGPAAFSVLEIPLGSTGFAYQNETLVHADHRGRRLGLLSKAVNLQALRQFRPDVHRIHTWNAGENHHMLAINDELGFRPTGWEGEWQWKRPEPAGR